MATVSITIVAKNDDDLVSRDIVVTCASTHDITMIDLKNVVGSTISGLMRDLDTMRYEREDAAKVKKMKSAKKKGERHLICSWCDKDENECNCEVE